MSSLTRLQWPGLVKAPNGLGLGYFGGALFNGQGPTLAPNMALKSACLLKKHALGFIPSGQTLLF